MIGELTFVWSNNEQSVLSETTVELTKSGSDVIFCLQVLTKTLSGTQLDLTRIERSLVYKSYLADSINREVIYRL